MCLVSYCHCYSSEVISSAIDQLHKLIDWKVCLDTLSKYLLLLVSVGLPEQFW